MKNASGILILLLVLSVYGCGGSGASAKTSGSADVKAIEELKGIGAEIENTADTLLKPLDEVDALLGRLREMPQRLGMEPAQFGAAVAAAMSGKSVTGPDGLALEANAQAEISEIAQQLRQIIQDLEAIPKKVEQLLAKIVVAIPAGRWSSFLLDQVRDEALSDCTRQISQIARYAIPCERGSVYPVLTCR